MHSAAEKRETQALVMLEPVQTKVSAAIDEAIEAYREGLSSTGVPENDPRFDVSDVLDEKARLLITPAGGVAKTPDHPFILRTDLGKTVLHVVLPQDFSRDLLVAALENQFGCALTKDDFLDVQELKNVDVLAGGVPYRVFDIPLEKLLIKNVQPKAISTSELYQKAELAVLSRIDPYQQKFPADDLCRRADQWKNLMKVEVMCGAMSVAANGVSAFGTFISGDKLAQHSLEITVPLDLPLAEVVAALKEQGYTTRESDFEVRERELRSEIGVPLSRYSISLDKIRMAATPALTR